jgi:hypothetical protein
MVFGFLTGLLALTGLPFVIPLTLRLVGNNTLGLLHLHVMFGMVLAAAVAWYCRKAESRALLTRLWHGSIPRSASPAGAALAKLLLLCFGALLISGIGLVFVKFLPHFIVRIFLYVHGAGSSLLFVLMGFWGVLFVTKGKAMKRLSGTDTDAWRNRIIPGVFELPLTHAVVHNKVEGFLQVFGWILKQSKLRMFLDDYRRVVPCKDIFNGATGTETTFTPGDYLISIYVKYFMTSGWLDRGVFSGNGLTARHIDKMASLFYGYVPFNRCRDFDDGVAHQGLMAKYGRFILSEMGIVPNAASSDSALSRSLKMFEM